MNLTVLDVVRSEVRAYLREGPTQLTLGRDLGVLLATLPVAEARGVAAGLAQAALTYLADTTPKTEPGDTGAESKGA